MPRFLDNAHKSGPRSGPRVLAPIAIVFAGLGFALYVILGDSTNPGEPSRAGGAVKAEAVGWSAPSELPDYGAVIAGRFGDSDTAAYDRIATQRLSGAPYGENHGRLFTQFASYLGLAGPIDLVKLSRVAVAGRVVAIGKPHFNSGDGAFWDPDLHEEAGVVDVSARIYRDVLFEVEEVWGTELPGVKPGSQLTFISPGGQVQVEVSDEAARKMELGGGGRYVFADEVPVDLAEDEQALVFLNAIRIRGLYGGKYGYRFELHPAHALYYKYTLDGRKADNETHLAGFDINRAALKALVALHLGDEAGPEPKEGTFPEPPHPPVKGEGEGAGAG